jgi:hypothetical protein
MTHEPSDDRHVESRAQLLPEEKAAGSENPEAQAEEILEDSERRTQDPSGTRNASSQTLGEE